MKIVLDLAGGLALFLYGMHLCAEALKTGSSRNLKKMIKVMAHGRVRGVFFGIGATLLTQSASATSVLILSLVNTSLITLAESAPILLGGAVGTSFTVQLISFRVAEYALLPVFLGIILILFGRNERLKLGGSVLLGFGLIFFGIETMIQALAPLAGKPAMSEFMLWLADKPWLAFLGTSLITAILHSSGAAIGLLLSLSLALGGETRDLMLVLFPMILGANLGACMTAFTASLGTRREARRVALLQLLLRLIAILLIWPFSEVFIDGMLALSGENVSRAIANSHTGFNILAAVVLLPLTGLITGLVRILMPARGDDDEYRAVGLDANLISTPGLALAAVQEELGRLTGLVRIQYKEILNCFFAPGSLRLYKKIEAGEERIDRIYQSISRYLNQVLGQRTTSEIRLLGETQFSCVAGLESLADIVVKNVLPLAKKYQRLGVAFSQAGKAEIIALHAEVGGLLLELEEGLACTEDLDWLGLVNACEAIGQEVDELRLNHLGRLVAGERASSETSAIHLDLLECLRRIENGVKRLASMYAARGGSQ